MSNGIEVTSPTYAFDGKVTRLLVVSNRLPVTITKTNGDYSLKMSSGGLVSALSGCKKMMTFTWIGWPGQFSLKVIVRHDLVSLMCV